MLVVIGGFVYWFGCSLLFYYFLILIIYFFILYFNNFSFLFFLSLSSPFSSELCGWQDLGAPAEYQAWALDVGELSSRHWTTREILVPRNINQRELSQRSLSQRWDPAPLNDQQAPVLGTLCQTTSKTGTHPHLLGEGLPKIILSSQTHQNTPLDAVLPTRKTRYSLIHQNTGTSPLHQEAYTTYWLNITHWRQTPKTMGTTNLQPAKRRTQTQ